MIRHGLHEKRDNRTNLFSTNAHLPRTAVAFEADSCTLLLSVVDSDPTDDSFPFLVLAAR